MLDRLDAAFDRLSGFPNSGPAREDIRPGLRHLSVLDAPESKAPRVQPQDEIDNLLRADDGWAEQGRARYPLRSVGAGVDVGCFPRKSTTDRPGMA